MGMMFNKPWPVWIELLNHPDHDHIKMDEDDKRIIAMCFAEMIRGQSKEWETVRDHHRLKEILDGAFAYWESSKWYGKGLRTMSYEERILREAGFRPMLIAMPTSWLFRLLHCM
jgi:hypothetical protein